ncbi:hypothetical protein HK405_013847 [Cladochytrium tenue]|nr:hypothetical protein HK405_013847 [Cladochytrium tenue]
MSAERSADAEEHSGRALVRRLYYRWCRMAALHLGRGLLPPPAADKSSSSLPAAAADHFLEGTGAANLAASLAGFVEAAGAPPDLGRGRLMFDTAVAAAAAGASTSATMRMAASATATALDAYLQMEEDAEDYRNRRLLVVAMGRWWRAAGAARFELARRMIFAETWAQKRVQRRVLRGWRAVSGAAPAAGAATGRRGPASSVVVVTGSARRVPPVAAAPRRFISEAVNARGPIK